MVKIAVKYGNITNLTISTTTMASEEKLHLQEFGFETLKHTRTDTVNYVNPCVLIKPLKSDASSTNWEFSDIEMLDLNNWDLRDIYADGC